MKLCKTGDCFSHPLPLSTGPIRLIRLIRPVCPAVFPRHPCLSRKSSCFPLSDRSDRSDWSDRSDSSDSSDSSASSASSDKAVIHHSFPLSPLLPLFAIKRKYLHCFTINRNFLPDFASFAVTFFTGITILFMIVFCTLCGVFPGAYSRVGGWGTPPWYPPGVRARVRA